MSGNQMAACGTGISVSVVMKPFHLCSCAILGFYKFLPSLAFLFGKAHGGLDIETGTSQQVAGQDFLGHVVYDHFPHKPRAPFQERPSPEVRMKLDGSRGLTVRSSQRAQQRVGFRHDIESHFIVDDIPGSAGGPAGEFIVPCPFVTLEVIIPKPADTAG